MSVAAAAPDETDLDTVELRRELEGLLERRLTDDNVEAVFDIFNRMEKEINSLEAQVEENENEHSDSTDAINKFLDVVDRPVGTRTFTVPPSSETNRAILGLYDAVNRNL